MQIYEFIKFQRECKDDELFHEKNYMKIEEVMQFFNKVKKINIFTRREIIQSIL